MKKTTIRNLIYSLIVLMLFGAVMLVLTRTAQNGLPVPSYAVPPGNPAPASSNIATRLSRYNSDVVVELAMQMAEKLVQRTEK